jgi:hypothetical protein
MAEKKKSLAKRLAEKYREASARAPEAKLALDLNPITGIPMSALDAAASAAEGKYGDAGLELLGVVPAVKLIKGAGHLKDAVKYAGKKAEAARTIDRISDSVSYAGEKTAQAKERTGLKKGGSVKPRGVGIAKRGWGRAGK